MTAVVRCAAIDLSLTGTAVAHMISGEQRGVVKVNLVKLGEVGLSSLPIVEQVDALNRYVNQIVDATMWSGVGGPANRPTDVGIETPALSRAGGGVFERGYVWFSVVGELQVNGYKVHPITPQWIKQYAAGKGNASKGAVIDGVARRFPMFETGGDEDLADAAAACALLADYLGHPLAAVPAAHLKAVEAMRGTGGRPAKRARKATTK